MKNFALPSFVFVAAALLFNLSFAKDLKGSDDDQYKTYCNSRFGFCVEYPKDFIPEGEADNGDGQVFSTKEKPGAELRVYGSNNALDESFETVYKNRIKWIEKEGDTVTLKKHSKTEIILSGFKDKATRIYYTKILKGDGQNFIMTMEYPKNDKEKMDGVVSHISKSFKDASKK